MCVCCSLRPLDTDLCAIQNQTPKRAVLSEGTTQLQLHTEPPASMLREGYS